MNSEFGRVQFTPNLLPSEVTGSTIYDEDSKQFQFNRGLIFSTVFLADEINRATPRTQSALLKAMAEFQVTADKVTHKLENEFFVIATLDPETLKELIRDWKKLGELNLSPREEVIHYYNLFHDAVQKVHYTAHETPPSCIVFEDLKDVNPKLEKSVYVVTGLYTRCFYGNKDVNEKAVKTFRKGMTNIMRVYGIA